MLGALAPYFIRRRDRQLQIARDRRLTSRTDLFTGRRRRPGELTHDRQRLRFIAAVECRPFVNPSADPFDRWLGKRRPAPRRHPLAFGPTQLGNQ